MVAGNVGAGPAVNVPAAESTSAGAPGEPEELAADVEDWPLDVIEAKIDGLFATY